MLRLGWLGQKHTGIGLLNNGKIGCGVMSVQQSGVKESGLNGVLEHQHKSGILRWSQPTPNQKIYQLWSRAAFGRRMGL
jgi:hypothetical protein